MAIMSSPALSVITPSYNSAEFIEDAILSVSRQSNVSAEHIVVDGGSTDGTLEILKRQDQVKWSSESDRGQSDAINKGFLRASGALVGWLNADDYYLPGGLATIAKAAEEHPEADVIYGDCVFVDREGKIVRSKVEHEFDRSVLMYFGCYIPSTSTFFRRRVIDSGQLLDCEYRVCMDFEYFARLAHAGVHLSLCTPIYRRVSLAWQQRQLEATGPPRRRAPAGAAALRGNYLFVIDP